MTVITVITLLIVSLVVPGVMLLGAGVMSKGLADAPNNFVGYRTRRSMASAAAWNYANKRCGQVWHRLGLILLITSPVAVLVALWCIVATGTPLEDASSQIAWTSMAIAGGQIICMLVSIHTVERELQSRFTESGQLRTSEEHRRV